jgi:hypothetical protein
LTITSDKIKLPELDFSSGPISIVLTKGSWDKVFETDKNSSSPYNFDLDGDDLTLSTLTEKNLITKALLDENLKKLTEKVHTIDMLNKATSPQEYITAINNIANDLDGKFDLTQPLNIADTASITQYYKLEVVSDGTITNIDDKLYTELNQEITGGNLPSVLNNLLGSKMNKPTYKYTKTETENSSDQLSIISTNSNVKKYKLANYSKLIRGGGKALYFTGKLSSKTDYTFNIVNKSDVTNNIKLYSVGSKLFKIPNGSTVNKKVTLTDDKYKLVINSTLKKSFETKEYTAANDPINITIKNTLTEFNTKVQINITVNIIGLTSTDGNTYDATGLAFADNKVLLKYQDKIHELKSTAAHTYEIDNFEIDFKDYLQGGKQPECELYINNLTNKLLIGKDAVHKLDNTDMTLKPNDVAAPIKLTPTNITTVLGALGTTKTQDELLKDFNTILTNVSKTTPTLDSNLIDDSMDAILKELPKSADINLEELDNAVILPYRSGTAMNQTTYVYYYIMDDGTIQKTPDVTMSGGANPLFAIGFVKKGVVPPPPPPPGPGPSPGPLPGPLPKPSVGALPDDNKMRVLLSNFMVPNYQMVYYEPNPANPYLPQQMRQEYTSVYFERIIDDKLSLLRNSDELRKKYRIDKVLASLEKYEDMIDDYTRTHNYDRSEGERKYNYEKAMQKVAKRVKYLNKIIQKLDKEKFK